MLKSRIVLFVAFALGVFSVNAPASRAQEQAPPAQAGQTPAATDDAGQDPLKRQLPDKEKFKQQKDLRLELKGPYKKWVDEDVHWIITDQELKAFKSLS